MLLHAVLIDGRDMHLSWRDADVLGDLRGAIVPAERKPQRQHVESHETGDGKRALQREHHADDDIDRDDHEQHGSECLQAEAAMGAQDRVHEKLTFHDRRVRRAFPAGRHGG